MKLGLAVLAGVMAGAGGAAAAPVVEFAGDLAPRPARDVVEASCVVDVRIAAGLATVETRQRLANRAGEPRGAAYELELPAGARVLGAAVRLDGAAGDDVAIAVPAGFATEVVADAEVVGADPAIVEWVGAWERGRDRYRVVVEALDGGRGATVTTRWTVPVTIADGALRVDLPGRGGDGQLAPCRGTLRAVAGPGATVTRLRAGDTTGGARELAFVLGDADLVLDAELAFARDRPLAWAQHEDLGDGWTAGLVTVVAPPATAMPAIGHRALFVIDVSRSMEMIGRAAVARVVAAAAAALPAGSEVDAILYDRAAARVLGAWQPVDRAVPAILAALAGHPVRSGSDLAAALAIARAAIGDGAGERTEVVAIGDGVLGELAGDALVDALAGGPSGPSAPSAPSAIDVHAIVLTPGSAAHPVAAPEAAQLERLVERTGGNYVELAVGDLDTALAGAAAWLRPSWLGVAVAGVPDGALPSALGAGAGATATVLAHGALPAFVLVARGDARVEVAARDAGVAAIGAHALADAERRDATATFAAAGDGHARRVRARLHARHPAVDAGHALAMLATTGRVARSRRDVVVAGGPYTRTVAVADPAWPAVAPPSIAVAAPSAIDRSTVERLLRDGLQPAAYACYQRALGGHPELAGTVRFDLQMSRGEVTSVALAGLGDPGLDDCLVNAAYELRPPIPDFSINSDDETVVHYPLTLTVHEDRPVVVAGDADSSQPIDIAAVRGGVPGEDRAIHVDARTPLGGLRP